MKGWHIFLHSVQMVLRNLHPALQIGLVPIVLMAILSTVLTSSTGLSLDMLGNEQMMRTAFENGQINIGGLLLFACISVFFTLWIFVNWHRYVLLEEYPTGWIPPLRLDRILTYFGKSLMIGLAMAVMLVPLGLAFLLGPIGALLFVLGAFFVVVTGYRWFLLLPAAAIGDPLSMREAWDKTRGASGGIILMLVLVMMTQVGLDVAIRLIAAVLPIAALVVQWCVALVLMLVNVSLLTTMYGHFIQDRPIN